jgi:hypothetical protein
VSENGKTGRVVDALSTILSSPVGGWALAVLIVAYMGWFVMRDRQIMYEDLKHLREIAIPLLTRAQSVADENHKLLEEILRKVETQQREPDQ